MLENVGPNHSSLNPTSKPSHRRKHEASAGKSAWIKTGICGFLSLQVGGVSAQANPFANATVVPGAGMRGGPLPLAPPLAPTPAPLGSPSAPAPAPLGAGAGTSYLREAPGDVRGYHVGVVAAPSAIESLFEKLHKYDAADIDASLRVEPSRSGLGHRKLLANSAATPLISMPMIGCSSADYSAPVTVGGQTFSAIIDTGSTTFGVASNKCTNCSVTPTYTLSTTAKNTGIAVTAEYGSGAWRGVEVQDIVRLGSGPNVSMVLADITLQQNFFKPSNCIYGQQQPSNDQAIMGMGPLDLLLGDTDSYISSVQNALRYPGFAFAACDSGGKLYLGGYPSDQVSSVPFYTPFASSNDSPYVAVGMLQLNVGRQDVGARIADFGLTVVDTGSSGIIFPTNIYQAIVQQVVQATKGQLSASFFSSGSCLRLSPGTTPAAINAAAPPMTFFFYNPNGAAFNLSAPATHSYLDFKFDRNNAPYVCPLLVDAGDQPQTLLGNTIMRNNTVIFDLQKGQVGFAPSGLAC